ncbi:MAG: hypothetical protein ABSF85_04935 [Terriglobales bacterium]|jgi:hypothetical protein
MSYPAEEATPARLLDVNILHLPFEGGQVLLAHPAAHIIHRLHDDLPAIP